jgi:hypothetical protein
VEEEVVVVIPEHSMGKAETAAAAVGKATSVTQALRVPPAVVAEVVLTS